MKFVCTKDEILKELSIAQEVISTRNTLSILSNVLLDLHDSTLVIKATDLKVSFETQMSVEAGEEGSTTVFCDKLLGIVRSLPEGDVEFSLTDQTLDIKPMFKKIDFQLRSIASDKFPELQDIGNDQYFEIAQRDLLEMIRQTIFAVSDDETRYFMNGVFMENLDSKLVMVATDGRRLSFIRKEVSSDISEFSGVIIPPKILTMISRLATGEGNISLAVSDKNIFAKLDGKKLSSNLIEGQFPKYDRVIPESQEYTISVNKNELNEALNRVSLLVEQKSRRIYVSVNDNTLLLHSEESDIGVAREEINCEYEGPETSIALNYQYLHQPLRVISDESIEIKFTDTKKAISVVSKENRDYVHIIAPMQLD